MLFNILKFEWKYWLKRPITYVFPFLVFLLAYTCFTVDNITLGGELAFRNSPSTLLIIYMLIFFFLPLFTSSFVSSAISRDFEHDFAQILYSMPIRRMQLMLGRFLGGISVVSIIFLGIVLADLLAGISPWVAENVMGPFHGMVHLQYYFLFVLPNVFLVGAILFAVTAWTKNNNAAFLTAIAIIVSYLTFLNLSGKLDNKFIAGLMDPFGIVAAKIQTDKWTAYENNNNMLQVTQIILWNRIMWILIGATLWTLAYNTFSLQSKKGAGKKEEDEEPFQQGIIKKIVPEFSFRTTWNNIQNQAFTDYWNIVKSPSFVVVVGLMAMMLGLQAAGTIQMDDAGQTATTWNTIQFLGGVSAVMSIAMIFFAGILIWKERDAKMNDIYDALPHKTSSSFLGKILALVYLCFSFYLFLIICGSIYQLLKGHESIDLGLYFTHFYLEDFVETICLAMLAVLLQIMINNKYIAYFISGLILVGEDMFFSYFEWSTHLVGITPSVPGPVYSDFYGYGPYTKSMVAFGIYWLMIYSLLGCLAYLFFVRGHLNTWKERAKTAAARFPEIRLFAGSLMVIFLGYTAFLIYETQYRNPYYATKELKKRKALYEKKYEKLKDLPTPSVVDVLYKIDLYPQNRKLEVDADFVLVNKTKKDISKIYVNNSLDFNFDLNIPGAKLVENDSSTIKKFQTYQLSTPLKPGDTMKLSYKYKEFYEGIENEVSNDRLLPNGSFIDFDNFTPMLGYDQRNEIGDKKDREEYGLPLKTDYMGELTRNCTDACMKDYIGGMGDWVNVRTVISTDGDQVAIAPGSMRRHWKEAGRNCYEYQLDHPSKFFFSIVSGKYEIARDSAEGVLCEVYYHKAHAENVPEMMKALKKSISYYVTEFGPYYHKQARIIEFPRFSSFAQAFPGTMPYSESIGFTIDLKGNTGDINQVFHVVAHEMAHQWWAHQVTGAAVKGGTLLSESLAEYSSLKLMEKEYGLDMATKFLKESNNDYIFGRARENKVEATLMNMQSDQSYLHYNKGSVVLFGIQQVLGEKTFNSLLKQIVQEYAYKEPPYPTSYALYDKVLAAAPDTMKYYVKDGLEQIVVFKNEIVEASTKKLPNNQYQTTVRFKVVKNMSDPNAKVTKDLNKVLLGQSKEVVVNDYMDIVLFDKKEENKRYGKKLAMQRLKITGKENEWVAVTDKKPHTAVIDPYFMYIHKDPQENMKEIK